MQEYADAEPLLLDNYDVLTQKESQIQPDEKDALLRDAIARLIRLYEAWGKPEEAEKWRNELASQPAHLPEN